MYVLSHSAFVISIKNEFAKQEMEVLMIDLKQSVQYIKGVGPSRAKLLSLLGVNTVEDLINYYPRTYEDRTKIKKIEELQDGEDALIEAVTVTAATVFKLRRNMSVSKVMVQDDTGRCLKKIDNKGRGPGEYLRIESIDINTEKEELMLVDGMSDKLFFYDLDGNFKSIHSIRYFQTENTLCLRDSVFLHISAPSQNFGNEGLYGYALVLSKGNENFLKGYRYLPLQVGYKGGGQIFKGYERSCYHPIYSDTIYQILSDTTYGPIFYFKIKNSSWEKYHNSDRFVDIDGSEEGVFTLLYENQDFFLGYIADKKKKGNYMQPFLYDKMKDKTYLLRWCDYYEHLKELDYFEGYEARGIFEDYFIAHVSFSTLDQYNIFERVKDGALKITNPELERVIQNLNTDSNPVLILTKFKHL